MFGMMHEDEMINNLSNTYVLYLLKVKDSIALIKS